MMMAAAVALAGAGPCGSALAQDEAPIVDVVFSNPGARSIGFGGAFVALADDATAAFANPAGLVQLLRPEISGEVRIGIETESAGVLADDEEAEATGLGFLSVVYPGRGWSVAAYGHRAASYTVTGLGTADERASRQLVLATFGLAGSYRLSEHLSLGLGLAWVDASRSSSTLFDGSGGSDLGGNDWSITAGLLWSPGNGWKLGAALRQGAELHFDQPVGSGQGPQPLVLPVVLSAGASWRGPDGRLTLSGEWDRVRYSSLSGVLQRGTAGPEVGSFDDGDQVHLGAEYAFLDWSPITAFRLGAWSDRNRPRLDLGADAEDEMHVAGGVGLAWRSFQLDVGLDVSSRRSTISVSGIVSF